MTDAQHHAVQPLVLCIDSIAYTIGEHTRQARVVRGLSHAEAAERLGVGTQHLQRVESAACSPGLSLFLRILAVFQLSADALLGWRASPAATRGRVIEHSELATILGPAVRRARQAHGIELALAAQRLGISTKRLRRLENAETRPGLMLFVHLLEEFDLSADELLRTEAEP